MHQTFKQATNRRHDEQDLQDGFCLGPDDEVESVDKIKAAEHQCRRGPTGTVRE
jgi:hypothetical protein